MSHKATYWLATIDPKLITSGSFRVLFHLCDHHNDSKDPERACFPSQETLIEKTGLSNGGLNKCLDTLESVRLLARKRSTIPGTAKRRTYFMLGCDVDLTTTQTPLSGDSANSTPVETATEQTPLSDVANSTFEGGKLHPSGEEPVKEPVKEQCVSEAATHTDFFDVFWEAHPRPNDEARSKQLFDDAVEAGVDPERIAAAAAAYDADNKGNSRQYLKMSDNWLSEAKWENHRLRKAAPETSIEDLCSFWAAKINGDGFVAPNSVTASIAREMVERKLVTPEKLKERGIAA